MKKMKRILAALLALVMCLGMSTVALATEQKPSNPTPVPETAKGENGESLYKLSIKDGKAVTNHKYDVYQIYTGDVALLNEKGVLSNIKYGENYCGVTDRNEDKEIKTGDSLTDAEINWLKGFGEDQGLELAKNLENQLAGDPITSLTFTNKYSVNVPGGYYLIKDVWAGTGENATVPSDEVFSNFVISIVGATEFAPKAVTKPKLEKTAVVNAEELTVVSDKKVGDKVDFKLTATLPSDFGTYDSYEVTFEDTLSDGLDYEMGSIKVKVVKATTEEEEITNSLPSFTGRKLEYLITVFDNTTPNTSNFGGLSLLELQGAKIIVTYTATINNDAIDRIAETNTAELKFTNGPGSSTGTTPKQIVTVLMAKLKITKTDENSEKLPGAGFTLSKCTVGEDDSCTEGDEVKKIEKDVNKTEFIFEGLVKDQVYILKESETPAGYNTIDPIVIKVKYDEIDNSDGGKKIDNLVVETLGTMTKDGKLDREKKSIASWVADDGTATASTNIMNKKGLELPSTGGIGTTIFYVIGGLLVVGAGILLITKKRMGREE